MSPEQMQRRREAHKQLCLHNQIVRAEEAVSEVERYIKGLSVSDEGHFLHEYMSKSVYEDMYRRLQWHKEWRAYGYRLREKLFPTYRNGKKGTPS